ncbi:hypothetical protein MHLP_04430 [Candidatus Mycoplasma haematolamae str. Purdue]|uniref:Uncharacterized protein n=1 Tax=Mycoplasma haematolamae (strain Purdue) TaxID=1212765 RepID=I7CH28_MYCHA|nr:hypothetical protein [Candidatus Mycoplasma haematolamae]AFO52466.1 hypothetical protein MHLP_04430 [Candidatus Mycoplasma haematolamae str. Purdue]
MIFTSPGYIAAGLTLSTGMFANVGIFSAVQTRNPNRLVFKDHEIPEEFKQEGGYKGNDPFLKQQYQFYLHRQLAKGWYYNCERQDSRQKNLEKCLAHETEYPEDAQKNPLLKKK